MKINYILTLFVAFVAFSMIMAYVEKSNSIGEATAVLSVTPVRTAVVSSSPIPPSALFAFNGTNGTNSTSVRIKPGARALGQPIRFGTSLNCTDTDGGNVPAIRGTVRSAGTPLTDYCHSGGGQMYEYYCQSASNGTISFYQIYRQNYFCPTACGRTPYCY